MWAPVFLGFLPPLWLLGGGGGCTLGRLSVRQGLPISTAPPAQLGTVAFHEGPAPKEQLLVEGHQAEPFSGRGAMLGEGTLAPLGDSGQL
jgi:hypothetical protein